jgi:hypothetical protein
MVEMRNGGKHALLLSGNLLKDFHLKPEEDRRFVGQHSGTTVKRPTERM